MDSRKLGQILIEQGVVTQAQLDQALVKQEATGRFLGEILASSGAATEEAIARTLSKQFGLAFVDVAQTTVEPKALEALPKHFCSQHSVVPIFISKNTLTVAMVNPVNTLVVEEMRSLTGLAVRPVFGCPGAIRVALEKHYKNLDTGIAFSQASLSGAEVRAMPNAFEPSLNKREPALEQAANLAPVIERVNQMIDKAVDLGASDIHIEPERTRLNVRYRIDGVLQNVASTPIAEQAAIISRLKIMADMDITEKRLPQDGRMRTVSRGREVDLRVSTFPTIYGENMVIRLLDRSGGLLNLKDVGLSKDQLETFSALIRRPYGILLVTGPTGSGKTTTLYASLNEINSTQKNIITLEDPVEYEIPNVRQSQINVKAGLSFAAGLRSIVRQDPDIIMIGEIRDKETADIAIHAALTGHLVFSTLHTNDAPSAAARLIDMGVEPFLVASSVIGILAQRLIRILCPACKDAYTPSPELLKQLNLTGAKAAAVKNFYKEKGCDRCKKYGYSGRTGIYELLLPNERIKDLISRKASAPVIAEEALRSQMRSLRDAGLEKVNQGITSVSELIRVTEEVANEK